VRSVDPDAVGRLLKQVAVEELNPRFRALQAHEIHVKSTDIEPNDVVTEADLAVERRLTPELAGMLPGSVVVGEEAVAADPRLVEKLSAEHPVWLVDPLDGTRNFAEGRETFGSMVALAVRGETVASWIYLPREDALFVAERGAGAFVDGRRLTTSPPAEDAPLVGCLYGRKSMPSGEFDRIKARIGGRVRLGSPRGSAAIEYVMLVRGRRDFLIYHRLNPWDHAPGTLLAIEAGGAARHADATDYRPTNHWRTLLIARSEAAWEGLRATLLD
jgi:fructose-1,6-bisphosphatase/inositol monophosphatase family enzyme